MTASKYLNIIDTKPIFGFSRTIRGYQPAQKWLKDRKSRTLDFQDILHYQRIIKALVEKDREIKEIDAEERKEGVEG